MLIDGVLKRIKLGMDQDVIQETYGLSDKQMADHVKACEPPKKRGRKPKQVEDK